MFENGPGLKQVRRVVVTGPTIPLSGPLVPAQRLPLVVYTKTGFALMPYAPSPIQPSPLPPPGTKERTAGKPYGPSTPPARGVTATGRGYLGRVSPEEKAAQADELARERRITRVVKGLTGDMPGPVPLLEPGEESIAERRAMDIMETRQRIGELVGPGRTSYERRLDAAWWNRFYRDLGTWSDIVGLLAAGAGALKILGKEAVKAIARAAARRALAKQLGEEAAKRTMLRMTAKEAADKFARTARIEIESSIRAAAEREYTAELAQTLAERRAVQEGGKEAARKYAAELAETQAAEKAREAREAFKEVFRKRVIAERVTPEVTVAERIVTGKVIRETGIQLAESIEISALLARAESIALAELPTAVAGGPWAAAPAEKFLRPVYFQGVTYMVSRFGLPAALASALATHGIYLEMAEPPEPHAGEERIQLY